MTTEKQFNYEAEDLVFFATRIPKEFKKLLKYYALVSGVSVQDLTIKIIGEWLVQNNIHLDYSTEELTDRVKKLLRK